MSTTDINLQFKVTEHTESQSLCSDLCVVETGRDRHWWKWKLSWFEKPVEIDAVLFLKAVFWMVLDSCLAWSLDSANNYESATGVHRRLGPGHGWRLMSVTITCALLSHFQLGFSLRSETIVLLYIAQILQLAPVLKFLFFPHLIIVPVSHYFGLQQWLSQVWFSFKDITSNRKTFLSLSVWACRHINPHSAPFPGCHIPLHKSLIHKKIWAKTVTEKQNYCWVSVSCDLWWQAHNLSKKAVLC